MLSYSRFQMAMRRLFRWPTSSSRWSSIFSHGKLYVPYLIFVRCSGKYTDTELLGHFGLNNYQPTTGKNAECDFWNCVVLADSGEWTLLADDWSYTLWHMPSTRPTLARLGEKFDIFACSVGECDHSFDFLYYRNSQLVRKYVVDDPDFRSRIVKENFGDPLPGEAIALEQSDEVEIVLGIAASLGIKTTYEEKDCRVYTASRTKKGL